METSTPKKAFSIPNHMPNSWGSRIASGIARITSRRRDSSVDSTGRPRDCRKIKAALFTQSRIIMHR